ncbi:MAG: helix-turn-helix domain-containing protein [Candidatus Gracilibacteria bacterium]
MDLVRKLKFALGSSGLTEDEIAFYVQVLKSPNCSILDNAKKAKIAKDKAYRIYEELSEKGLLAGSDEGKYKKISALPLKSYVENLYKKGRHLYRSADNLRELRPLLKFINVSENSSLPEVLSAENVGSDWVDFAYIDWETVLAYGNFEMLYELMGSDPDKEFMRLRLRRGKKAYPILSALGPYTREMIGKDNKEMRTTKVIRDVLGHKELKNTFVMLAPDKNAVTIWVKNESGLVSGVKMENPVICKAHEDLFKYFNAVADSQSA